MHPKQGPAKKGTGAQPPVSIYCLIIRKRFEKRAILRAENLFLFSGTKRNRWRKPVLFFETEKEQVDIEDRKPVPFFRNRKGTDEY